MINEPAVRVCHLNGSTRIEGGATEALRRARQLVSCRVGVIADVQFQHLRPGEPPVYWAHSIPPLRYQGSHMYVRHHGFGASVDPDRAIVKAIGESIERYCGYPSNRAALLFGTANTVARMHRVLPIEKMQFFTTEQYATSDCPFVRPTMDTPLHWVLGRSLLTDDPVFVPAALVFVPYNSNTSPNGGEPPFVFPISTGLACGLTFRDAVYRGLLEVIERDAFMICWRNQLLMPTLDARNYGRNLTLLLQDVLAQIPVSCLTKVITLDIPVPVVLVMLRNNLDDYPLFAMGAGADFDMEYALALALEEALLCYCGLSRVESPESVYMSSVGTAGPATLELHGLAHAVDKSLQATRSFLEDASQPLADVPIRPPQDLLALVGTLAHLGHEIIAVDLTQPDIDAAGFKVVRVLVPGLQPLDVDHKWPYYGIQRAFSMQRQKEWVGFGGGFGTGVQHAHAPHPFA